MGVTEFAPGKSGHRPLMRDHEPGCHHGLLLEGEVELSLEDETIVLNAGDSYSFDQRKRHRVRNLASKKAVLVWAVSPVTLDVAENDPVQD